MKMKEAIEMKEFLETLGSNKEIRNIKANDMIRFTDWIRKDERQKTTQAIFAELEGIRNNLVFGKTEHTVDKQFTFKETVALDCYRIEIQKLKKKWGVEG